MSTRVAAWLAWSLCGLMLILVAGVVAFGAVSSQLSAIGFQQEQKADS
jgi:hypothetical protein